MQSRTYTTHLRNGKVIQATVNVKKGQPPLPYPTDPPQLVLPMLDYAKKVPLMFDVVDGCEMHHKEHGHFESTANHMVITKFGGREPIKYVLCESCADVMMGNLTPHSNTGSK